MVSEHASPLAARRAWSTRVSSMCTSRSSRRRWPRAGTRSPSTPGGMRRCSPGPADRPGRLSGGARARRAGRTPTHGRVAAARAERVRELPAHAVAHRAAGRRAQPLLVVRPRGHPRRPPTGRSGRPHLPRARRGAAPSRGRRRDRAARADRHQDRGRRAAARIVATCSDEVFELLRIGVSREKVSVVPCGVDVERFSPDGPRAPTTAPYRIVSVGRLVPHKGFADLIEVLPALPGAELVIAGGETGPEAEAEPRLRALAARAGVLANQGVVARAAVPRRPARVAALGRHRRVRAALRVLRHRAARSDGVRRPRSSPRRSAVSPTPSSTA